MKQFFKILFHRLSIVSILLVIQLLIFISIVFRFEQYFIYFYVVCTILSLITVLHILNSNSNPSYKIAWLIPILAIPIFGVTFYIIFGKNHLSDRAKRKMQTIYEKMKPNLQSNEKVKKELEKDNKDAYLQSNYIEKYACYPVYNKTQTEYLASGEEYFSKLKEELKQAKHYIFIESFIIEQGVMWNSILDILIQKVRENVEVRVIYDDLGCITKLPYKYNEKLEKLGIKVAVFNPFIPILTSRFNNRDHRKIIVIDGFIGFTGGINLADEYINVYPKYGHWKDTGILLKGEAVWSFTVSFLSIWDYIKNKEENYEKYRPQIHQEHHFKTDGFVQPYSDSPLDEEGIGENIYMNLICKAKDYIYITTPYLIIDNEMVSALRLAAKNGVDVRIITPHIPDKWYVHTVTRAYYETLLNAGVKIYEYEKGFIHSKTFVVDDLYATVGTVNLDYRSLYLHFECGTWLYNTKSVYTIKDDFYKTLTESKTITIKMCKKINPLRKLGRAILRIFAPLM